MDINNDLQQINTFVKGMNTDVSDALMDSSQYRYAENVRLTTNTDENTGEIRLIEGNSVYENISNYGKIIAMTSIRDLLIIVTKLSSDNGTIKKGNYILVDNTKNKSSNTTTNKSFNVTVVYWSGENGKLFSEPIKLVTRWESDNNVKLYIADGGPLMVVNVKSKYLTVGKEKITSVISQPLKAITASIYSNSGHLTGVRFQYCYRLYNMGMSASTISPLSTAITIYTSNGGIDTTKTNVDKSIKLVIPSLSSNYKYIQIFRIAYVNLNSDPVVDVIYDGKIINQFIDSGSSVDQIAYEEFKNYVTFVIYPKIIESKGDYLFAANITDGKQNVDSIFEKIDMRAISTGDKLSSSDYNIQFNPENILTYNEQYWHKTQEYLSQHSGVEEKGGANDFISWEPIKKYIYIDENNRKFKSQQDARDGINAVEEQMPSLRPGEIYRYGAVLFDSDNQRSSVKWIADIMVPYDSDVIPKNAGISTNNLQIYKFALYGIKFNINWSKLSSACENKCSSIEIVRCERAHDDRITITQGVAGYTLQLYENDLGSIKKDTRICSPGILSANKIVVGSVTYIDDALVTPDANERDLLSISNTEYITFSSPEYVYSKQDTQDILNKDISNITIQNNYTIACPMEEQYIGREDYDRAAYYRLQTIDDRFNYSSPYIKGISDSTMNSVRAQLSHTMYNNPTAGSPTDTLFWNDPPSWNGARRIDQKIFANNYTDSDVKVFMSHPKIYVSSENVYGNPAKIKNIGWSEVPKYDQLFDETVFKAASAISDAGGGIWYLNWSIPLINKYNNISSEAFNKKDVDDKQLYSGIYPIGSSGECMIINQNKIGQFCSMSKYSDITNNAESNWDNYTSSVFVKFPVLSLRSSNRTPYGGRQSVDYSIYQSFGNSIQKNDTTAKELYDGDCYPGIFIYNASHAWNEANCPGGIAQCNVYSVPLYSDIDLYATFGDLFPRINSNYKYFLQDTAGSITSNYTQSKDAYMYNSAYSGQSSAITYSAIAYTELDNSLYDTRVFHSNVKNNNEHIDNWLSFQELDFIDVDSRFGQITNMRLFKDKLMFWQEHAAGILSVNERTVLNDIDNNNIIVGTGDTLQRFDYISTIYGMKKNQYDAEIQSNYTQYWWDGYNKEILAYTGGMELIPLTKVKNLTNYVNKRQESNHPMLAYDAKYDEVFAQVVTDNVANNTIVYNEQIQAFSSIYTFAPLYKAIIGNDLYIADYDHIYIQNKQDLESYAKLFNKPIFPKIRIVVNKNNIYTKTFDNIVFGGRMYQGSVKTIANWQMEKVPGEYITKEHLNSPMHHLTFTFETPLKQKSQTRGDKAISVNEYDYRLAVPRNGQSDSYIEYGNRMRGKTMQCEISSDYNSTDFSLQYIITKFRMSWS